jgi:hypothetical protein
MLVGACIASYEQSTVQLVCTAGHALLKDLCVDYGCQSPYMSSEYEQVADTLCIRVLCLAFNLHSTYLLLCSLTYANNVLSDTVNGVTFILSHAEC